MLQNLLQANLLELLGLTSLPRDRQLTILNKLTDLVQRRVVLRIVADLKEEDKEKAERIFKSGTEAERAELLSTVTDVPTIIEQEIVSIKKDLLDEVNKLEV